MSFRPEVKEPIRPKLTITNWPDCLEFAQRIVEELDRPSWPPWLLLQESAEDYVVRTQLFPQGQLIASDEQGRLAGYLSTNLIYWNGRPESLTSWDDVVGLPNSTSCAETFVPNGNAIVLLVISVGSDFRGTRLPTRFLNEIKEVSRNFDVQHIISPFRPNWYGVWKRENNLFGNETFADYCELRRKKDDRSVDPWLRALERNNMNLIRDQSGRAVIISNSMQVIIDIEAFEQYRKIYKPNLWRNRGQLWECDETGTWIVFEEEVTYVEPNVWGSIPF